MSEERRKRQQEREGLAPKTERLLLWAIVAVVAGAGFAVWYHLNHRYDGFAQCLASKQVKMYGLYYCPHCAEQKEKFGRSFQYVPYVECAVKGKPGITDECQAAGTKLFPSWQFGNSPPKEGVFSLEELSDKSGCGLP